MFSYDGVRRNKQRLLAVVAATAAGAGAAYYVYTRWFGVEDEMEQRSTVGPPAGAVSRSPQAAPGAEESEAAASRQADMDGRLATHFASVQEIATGTTLPSLMPSIKQRMAAHTDVESTVAFLRANQDEAGEPLGSERKVELWNKLKVEGFVYALTSVWALSLLDVLLRVQLNILGRFLFLDTTGTSERPTASADPRQGHLHGALRGLLPPACQEQYLQYADHLSTNGISVLLAKVRAVVEPLLLAVPLTKQCSVEDLLVIISEAQEALASAELADVWPSILLPEPIERAQPGLARVEHRMNERMAEDRTVQDMLAEARTVLSTSEFQAAVRAAVAATSSTLEARLRQSMLRHGERLPLAKAIPVVVAAGNGIMDTCSVSSGLISQLPPVSCLSVSVYSGGPPL